MHSHPIRWCQPPSHRTQRLLLSKYAADHDKARDMIAAMLTQHHGEYVFRLGARPSTARLFTGESIAEADGWTGVPRNDQEIDTLCQMITRTVDEVGGKVILSCRLISGSTTHIVAKASVLFHTKTPRLRASLLLRLPPANVSTTPEVRCAVVGNVDSGKSTTLGVLTRGMTNSFFQSFPSLSSARCLG